MEDTSTPAERWLPVPGHEGRYEVSDHGRVWSVKRIIALRNGETRTVGGRVLKGGRLKGGHRTVSLATTNGAEEFRYVHRLVLEAFVGSCPEGMECCHWDDDPGNNRLDNLRWGTRSENMLDRTRNGVDNNGTKYVTSCAQGHDFNESNTIYRDGHRACRTCKNAATRRRRAERLEANPRPERTHCRREHSLEGPNLKRADLPKRRCKACARAHQWVNRYGERYRLQEVADDFYTRIMATDQAATPKTLQEAL